ncbi:hypothetical protein OS493_008456 [Desmophyllum pertusum]|uniref:BEN domain-containing protein n=1 Tax=Desmophyllum pertusum TaxID=174260 RepID=A0A9X0D3V6_9CNID|nr:hypothetical protein OS493_008456 [Desmophyllum pertusum]
MAVVASYPLIDEIQKPPVSQEEVAPRRAKAKRTLIPESPPTPKKIPRIRKESQKKKEKPKGNIIETSSPTKAAEPITSDSDSEEDIPLSSFLPVRALTPLRDFSDDDEDLGGLLSKALNSVGDTANLLNRNDSTPGQEIVTEELRLTRTILERLECSFARQEAKLDRLLNLMAAAPPTGPQTPLPQALTQPPPTYSSPFSIHSSLEYASSAVLPRAHEMDRLDSQTSSRAVLQNLERLIHVDDTNVTGNDTVTLGGFGNVRISRDDFNFAKAAYKPTTMTLRLVDTLFQPQTLQRSTVHGTKEFAPLDQQIISAVKAEVLTAFSYQCRSSEDRVRIWDQCKTSIGKRCQNLRKGGDKQNRAE